MLTILNSLNAYNLPIFQPTLIILTSKFKVHRALSDKTYLSLGLLSPLIRHLFSKAIGVKLRKCFRDDIDPFGGLGQNRDLPSFNSVAVCYPACNSVK